MSGPSLNTILSLIRSQLTIHPKPITSSFEHQTVLVTGGNAGLGKAAARQLVQLKAQRVIIAVRTLAKGEEAKKSIESSLECQGVIEVWQLDLSSFVSVVAFGQRVKTLDRLDAVIENAGVWPAEHSFTEKHETTLTINVISTFLLAHMVLPKLRETALENSTTTRLTFVGSQLHKFATLTARKPETANIISQLNQQKLKKGADYDMRYNDTKLLLQMYAQRLAIEHSQRYGDEVCITVVNPGYCISALKPATSLASKLFEKILARSTEEGAIALVDAVVLDKVHDRFGQYVDDCQVKRPAGWLETVDGKATTQRVWQDINAVLDGAVPGLTTRL